MAPGTAEEANQVVHVLVVDDDFSIRQVIRFALEDEGYSVDEAPDGEAALAAIDLHHPDVILLDMRMPGMDGWDFVERYRENHGHRAPIIILTASQDPFRGRAEIHPENHLAKPFDLDVLLERIAALVERAAGEKG
nr:MAG: response regulator [Sphaerobacter thermophilus]